MGQERNRTIATMMRECYTTCVVRVFSCATAPAQTHYEKMAYARSCTDMHLNRDHLPKTMTDRLRCTALGHPMKLSEPTAVAHAAVTPLTLQARLHTIPMMRADGCEWAYDQVDRYHRKPQAKKRRSSLRLSKLGCCRAGLATYCDTTMKTNSPSRFKNSSPAATTAANNKG